MSTAAARTAWSLGLASAAIIAFQLVIMQLLAVSQWHHFAYMVISMALLGFGAAGTVLALFREPLARRYATALPALYLASGLAMAATAWLSGLVGEFDAFLLFFDRGQLGRLLFTYLAYCLPFFCGGLAITLVFYREVGQIGAHYFANMAGSGAGALLIIGLFWLLPAERLAGALALLLVIAAWLTRPGQHAGRAFVASCLVGLAVALWSLVHPAIPTPSEYKALHAALQLPEARVVHSSSSPFGRLEVVRAPAQRFAPSLSLQYRHEPPLRDVLYSNGEYFGTLLGRGAAGEAHILDHTTRALPYALRQPASVLVLGARTGNDVSHALSRGVTRITAVEPQLQVNRLLEHRHPEWTDALYLDPAVSVHGDSVRSYLARRGEAARDLVVLPVLGAFGGTAGVDALGERYDLTLEAFHAIWAGLADDGMIAVTAWHDQPPRVTLRLVATWRRLLDELGIMERQAHIAAVRSWGTATFLLSKSAIAPEERGRLRDFAEALGFDPLILEELRPAERERFNRVTDRSYFSDLDTLLAGDPAVLYGRYPFDVAPTTDDRPFFSRFVPWRSLPELWRTHGERQLPYLELGSMLAGVTFVQIVLVAVALIVLPLVRIGWRGARRRWTLLYFSGLGLGYMSFEIVLIQKLVLYLGQPVYSTAAVLATLLICSGAGSLSSSRLAASGRAPALCGSFAAALVLFYALALMPVLGLSMAWPVAAKAAAVFALLAPPAFVMGMMFPLGLRRLAGASDSHIPWACAIDSCLSVASTALATLVALGAGFGAVMLLAAAGYAAAALAAPRLGAPA